VSGPGNSSLRPYPAGHALSDNGVVVIVVVVVVVYSSSGSSSSSSRRRRRSKHSVRRDFNS